MPNVFLPALLLALSAGPAGSQTPAPAAEPYQVIRLGDGQMSCEALVAEIGGLTAEMDRIQRGITERSMAMTDQASRAMGGGAGGAAMSLGNMAAGFIPGADLLLGAASAAAAQGQLADARRMMTEQAEAITSDALAITPLSQRYDHLTALFRQRSC